MKILIIKTAPGEIDVKKITYNHQEIGLAKSFIRLGHNCDVMCCADSSEKTIQIPVDGRHITLYCLKAKKILKNGFYKNIDSIIANYDILHVSEYN